MANFCFPILFLFCNWNPFIFFYPKKNTKILASLFRCYNLQNLYRAIASLAVRYRHRENKMDTIVRSLQDKRVGSATARCMVSTFRAYCPQKCPFKKVRVRPHKKGKDIPPIRLCHVTGIACKNCSRYYYYIIILGETKAALKKIRFSFINPSLGYDRKRKGSRTSVTKMEKK